jgi:ATP-binding cassette subfamily B protein
MRRSGAATAFSLVTLGGLFFVVTVVQKAMELWTTYLSEDLGWVATNGLRADLAAHTMRLDMGFHKLQTPGELIERIDGDVSNLAEFFSQLVVRVLGNAVLVMGILVLLFREDWRIGLVGLAYGLLTLGLLQLIQQTHGERLARGEQGVCQTAWLRRRTHWRHGRHSRQRRRAYVFQKLYPLLASSWPNGHVKADVIGGYSFSSSYMLYVWPWWSPWRWRALSFCRGR